jgi:hypothetical protein
MGETPLSTPWRTPIRHHAIEQAAVSDLRRPRRYRLEVGLSLSRLLAS